DNEPTVAQHIGKCSHESDAARAIQNPLGIKRQSPFKEIVARIAIEQCSHSRRLRLRIWIAHNHEAFELIRHVEESIHRVNRLLLILLPVYACWVNSQRARRGNCLSIL